MKKGTKVKMSDFAKQNLIENDCEAHVTEFGLCEGIVLGLTDYGTSKGPEVDVRWYPSKLRFAYDPKTDLVRIK